MLLSSQIKLKIEQVVIEYQVLGIIKVAVWKNIEAG